MGRWITVRRGVKKYSRSAKAALWRRLMRRTTFIAVTGSYGKTTATECLGPMLAAHAPTNWIPGGANWRLALLQILLDTRPRHRYTLLEVGTNLPGALWRASWLIAPDIVVVLAVGLMHSHQFDGLEGIANEKFQLLRRLGRSGIAVLNRDDPWVWDMRHRCRGRVLSFGRTPEADLWASEVEARWPDRLSFRVTMGDRSLPVKTQLIGTHWVNSVLGALLGAVAAGVPLETAAAAVEAVEPVGGRMAPIRLPNGVWVLRDEFNESFTTLDAALKVLREARAGRRILVVGLHYDPPAEVESPAADLGRRVGTSADLAIFLGRHMKPAVDGAVEAGMSPEAVRSYRHMGEAVKFLRKELRPDDLILLRGAQNRHPERVYFRLVGEIQCEKGLCNILGRCDVCPELGFQPDQGRPEDYLMLDTR